LALLGCILLTREQNAVEKIMSAALVIATLATAWVWAVRIIWIIRIINIRIADTASLTFCNCESVLRMGIGIGPIAPLAVLR